MVSDWNNRSFKEMSESTGDAERTPYEIPSLVQITRTDDRSYNGGNRQRSPFDIPAANNNGGQQVVEQPSVNNGQWRQGLGTVAPGALDATNQNKQQQQQTGGQWRIGYGGVASSALEATSPDKQQQQAGGQWRANGQQVAPSALDATNPANNGQRRDLPQMTDPNANGGVVVPGDGGKWQPSPNQIGPGVGPGGVTDATGQATRVGSDPLATTGNGGIAAPSEQQLQWIDQSLHTHLNYFTHFVEGGIGGVLGASVIPYAGDKLFWKKSLDGNRVAEYWRSNHSPLGLQLRTVDGTVAELIQKGSELQTQLGTARTEFRDVAREFRGTPGSGTGLTAMQELQDATRKAATANPADLAIGKKAQMLDDFLQSRPATQGEFAAMRARLDGARLATDTSPMTESSFLTQAEHKMIGQNLTNYERLLQSKTNVEGMRGAVTASQAEIAAAQQVRDAIRARGGDFNIMGTNKTWTDAVPPGSNGLKAELSTWKGNEGPFGKGRAFAEGVGVVSAGLAATWAVDKFMPNMFGVVGGQDAKMGDHWRSYLQGPAIAASLLAPNKSTLWKVSAATASTVAIGVAEKFFPEPANGSYSKLMQPNWVDSVGMGAAWMMPFASWKSRAMAVGGAWALARGADFLNNVVGVHVPGIGDQNFAVGMQNDVAEALSAQKVSDNSFKSIQQSSFKLGMENEGALLADFGKFMNDKTHDPLYHLHGAAALYTALGDLYGERGTKIKQGALNDQGRILAGTGYDLGGQATDFYRQAVANLVEGQNQARRVNNTDAENAMKESMKEVTSRLDRIYGEHNIGNVLEQLKKEYTTDVGSLERYQVQLKQQVATLQTRDTQYAAKMCRDIALLDLAIVSVKASKNEGGGAQIMYAEALEFLAAAERIAGDNKDVKQIRQIADQLKTKVPQAVNNQYNSTINNPFRVGQ